MTIEPGSAYRRIDRNRRQTAILFVLFTLIVAPIFGFLAQYLAAFLLLLFAMPVLGQESGFSLLLTIIGFQLAAALLMIGLIIDRMVRFRRGLPEKLGAVPLAYAPENIIWRRLESLSIAASVPTPRLYILPDPDINAFATGSDPENSCIVVTRGVLEKLNRRELDGVISHELSHIANYDNRLNSTVAAILMSVRLPAPIYWLFVFAFLSLLPVLPIMFSQGDFMAADVFRAIEQLDVREIAESFGVDASHFSPTALLVLRLWVWLQLGSYILGLPLAMVWPALGWGIQALIARRREYLADAEAIRITRDPVGLASALRRILADADVPRSIDTPFAKRSSAVGHLCLVQPGKGPMAGMLRAHPPLANRIEALASMAPPEPLPLAVEDADAPLVSQLEELLSTPTSNADAPPGLASTKGWFPRLPPDPFTAGALAGIILQTILLIVGIAAQARLPQGSDPSQQWQPLTIFPFGVAGALSTYVVMHRREHFRWWPLVLMFVFGSYPGLFLSSGLSQLLPSAPGASLRIVPFVLAAIIEPMLGAWLGLVAVNGWPKETRSPTSRGSSGREFDGHLSQSTTGPASHAVAPSAQGARNSLAVGDQAAGHVGEGGMLQNMSLIRTSWRRWLLIAFVVLLALQLLGPLISILMGF